MDSLGIVTGPMILTLASGGIGTAAVLLSPGQAAKLRALPLRYWLACGGLFVAYAVAYNFGVGMAATRGQLLLFGILNYLWPVLTVLFSAAFQGRRIGPAMIAGTVVALAGILVALLSRPAADGAAQAVVSLTEITADLGQRPHVYLLGLFCGVSWALYSSLGRKLAGGSDARPVPLQFLAVGVVYLGIYLAGGLKAEAAWRAWTLAPVAALAYQALIVNLLAYSLWDAAMRRGNQGLVASAAFFTPLLSTVCVSLLLGVDPGWMFWAACLLVVAGAALCRWGETRSPSVWAP
jgi:drug/metabolite transporter (DMT)-like permease